MKQSLLAVRFVMFTENEVTFHNTHKIKSKALNQKISFLIEISNPSRIMFAQKPMASKKKRNDNFWGKNLNSNFYCL